MRRLGLAMLLAMAATPVAAQELNARVGKLESEMRAVQRRVFPGAGQYVEPEIQPDRAPPGPLPGTPATSPVADLTQRVSSLEQQMTSMTGQIEDQGNRLRRMEDEFAAYRRETDAKLSAAGSGAATPAMPAAPADDGPPPPRSARPTRPSRAAADDTIPPPSGWNGARGAADRPTSVDRAASSAAAVQRPSTGDAAEDGYTYGYRLWQAHDYAGAEAALKGVVSGYPRARRASYAQNLLGRVYLDQGRMATAATAFYDSYKKFPEGERAPESLLYLAQTLAKLNKPADACRAYGELTDVYGTKLTAAMKANVTKGRAAAGCP